MHGAEGWLASWAMATTLTDLVQHGVPANWAGSQRSLPAMGLAHHLQAQHRLHGLTSSCSMVFSTCS